MRCRLGRCVFRARASPGSCGIAVATAASNSDAASSNGSNKSSKWKPGPQPRARTSVIYCEIRDIAPRVAAAASNARTQTDEPASRRRRPPPRVQSGFVPVHYLAYAIAPRYICHLASSRPLETRIGRSRLARTTIDRAV